jgi:gliding motility-associated-like protein
MRYTRLGLKLIFSCFVILLLDCPPLFAQYENVWVFGFKAGIDFNGPSPVALETGINSNMPVNYHMSHGSASVCDANGSLLFYTDGSYIWDKNDNFMPNGLWIAPVPVGWPPPGINFSTTNTEDQCAVIVPMPGDPDKYYVFSKTRFGWPSYSRQLYYSVVDMSLNGGLGDVVSTQKSIFLDSAVMSSMIAVAGDDCNVWLITRKQDYYNRVDSFFQAFEITTAGVNHVPVVSTVPSNFTTGNQSYLWGSMAVSPDRRKIADTRSTNNNSAVITGDMGLYDFDPATGILSNEYLLSQYNMLPYTGASWIHGVCFSADNSKLYMTGQAFYNNIYQGHGGIYQFDLSSGVPVLIMNSMTYITELYHNDLKMGPDNKVYYNSRSYFINGVEMLDIGRIENPNLGAAACNPQQNILTLVPGTLAVRFPNTIVHPEQDTLTQQYDTTICIQNGENSWQLQGGTGTGYHWDDNTTTAERSITAPGTYWVKYRDGCRFKTDTFNVTLLDLSFSLGPDSIVCNSGPVALNTGIADGTYLWQDGSSNSTYEANTNGIYWAEVSQGKCTYRDSIRLTFNNLKPELGNDTLLCKDVLGQSGALILKAGYEGPGLLQWSTGSNAPEIPVNESGLYWLSISEPPCTGGDTIRIEVKWCDCDLMMPTAFSPNNDGNNDYFLPVLQNSECLEVVKYTFSVYNRWGQRIFEGRNGTAGWDGSFNGKLSDIGTYFYYITYSTGNNKTMNVQKGDVALIR